MTGIIHSHKLIAKDSTTKVLLSRMDWESKAYSLITSMQTKSPIRDKSVQAILIVVAIIILKRRCIHKLINLYPFCLFIQLRGVVIQSYCMAVETLEHKPFSGLWSIYIGGTGVVQVFIIKQLLCIHANSGTHIQTKLLLQKLPLSG